MIDLRTTISVIIPVFNAGNTIRRCIDSVVNQTYPYLQIVLVDDGSTDGSGDICEEYRKKDPRIQVIHDIHGGSVKARKRGLELCGGNYVSFVDADDYIEPQMYDAWIKEIDQKDVDIAYFGSVNEKNGKIAGYERVTCNEIKEFKTNEEKFIYLLNSFLNSNLDGKYSFDLFSKLYKRKLINNCMGRIPDIQQQGEDLLCNLRGLFESKKILMANLPLYHYQISEHSLSHINKSEQIISGVCLSKNILDVMEEYDLLNSLRDETAEFIHCLMCEKLRIEEKNPHIRIYEFDDIQLLKQKKVCIYGAGVVGKDYFEQLIHEKDIRVVACLDQNAEKITDTCMNVVNPTEFNYDNVDFIIIAIVDEDIRNQIIKWLLDYGVNNNKIIGRKPRRTRSILINGKKEFNNCI